MEEGGGTFYLARSFFRKFLGFFFCNISVFQFEIWSVLSNSAQLPTWRDQIWPSVALERIFEEDKDGGFVNRRLFVLWADVWREQTEADQFCLTLQCGCFRFIRKCVFAETLIFLLPDVVLFYIPPWLPGRWMRCGLFLQKRLQICSE